MCVWKPWLPVWWHLEWTHMKPDRLLEEVDRRGEGHRLWPKPERWDLRVLVWEDSWPERGQIQGDATVRESQVHFFNLPVAIPWSSAYKPCTKILVKWVRAADFRIEQLVWELLPSVASFPPHWSQWLRRLLSIPTRIRVIVTLLVFWGFVFREMVCLHITDMYKGNLLSNSLISFVCLFFLSE